MSPHVHELLSFVSHGFSELTSPVQSASCLTVAPPLQRSEYFLSAPPFLRE